MSRTPTPNVGRRSGDIHLHVQPGSTVNINLGAGEVSAAFAVALAGATVVADAPKSSSCGRARQASLAPPPAYAMRQSTTPTSSLPRFSTVDKGKGKATLAAGRSSFMNPPRTPGSSGTGRSSSTPTSSVGPSRSSSTRPVRKASSKPYHRKTPSLTPASATPTPVGRAHRKTPSLTPASVTLTPVGRALKDVFTGPPPVIPSWVFMPPAPPGFVVKRKNASVTFKHANDVRNQYLMRILNWQTRRGCILCDLHGQPFYHLNTQCPMPFDYADPEYADFLFRVRYPGVPACKQCWLPLVSGEFVELPLCMPDAIWLLQKTPGENYFHPHIAGLTWCPNFDIAKKVAYDVFRFKDQHLSALREYLVDAGVVPQHAFESMANWIYWIKWNSDVKESSAAAEVLIAVARRFLDPEVTEEDDV